MRLAAIIFIGASCWGLSGLCLWSDSRCVLIGKAEAGRLFGGHGHCNDTGCELDPCEDSSGGSGTNCTTSYDSVCSYRLGGICGKVDRVDGHRLGAAGETPGVHAKEMSTTIPCGTEKTGLWIPLIECEGRCTNQTPCGAVLWTCEQGPC